MPHPNPWVRAHFLTQTNAGNSSTPAQWGRISREEATPGPPGELASDLSGMGGLVDSPVPVTPVRLPARLQAQRLTPWDSQGRHSSSRTDERREA